MHSEKGTVHKGTVQSTLTKGVRLNNPHADQELDLDQHIQSLASGLCTPSPLCTLLTPDQGQHNLGFYQLRLVWAIGTL